MRSLEWGKFATQFADFTHRTINGQSIIIDGQGSNNSGNGLGGYFGVYWIVCMHNTSTYYVVKELTKIALGNIRAQVGHTPIILTASLHFRYYGCTIGGAYPKTIALHRLLKTPDYTDATYRNRDNTGPVTWTNDGYSPLGGADYLLDAFSSLVFASEPSSGTWFTWNIRSELEYCLRANKDMEFLAQSTVRNSYYPNQMYYWNTEGSRPYLDLLYLLPVEFFRAKTGGTIDLEHMLDNTTGSDEDLLDLGTVQRSETGQAVKAFAKNLRGSAITHLEIWDDYPEWTVPVQSAGSGTGQLDYVTMAEASVSQAYTVKFSSGSAYEVKAVAYRDYTTSLHSTYDGTPAWQGATSGDWTAPSGGLTIPAAAWQPGTAVNDEFTIYVLGNTTDTAWPSDSNDQAQITLDSAGSPDAANWRPVNGQRSKMVSSVTVDATTKKFPTRKIDTSLWTVGNRAFVADDTNIHHGAVDSVDAAALAAAVFTGAGLDDLTRSGNYNGTIDKQFRVEIDGTGTPDTFKWSNDGGSTWEAATVNITGAAQLLEDGVYITFAATTGHTATDRWDFDGTCWGVTLSGLTNDSTVYAAGSRIGTTLPIRNLAAAVWSRLSAAGGHSSTPANRLYLDDTTGFVNGQDIGIRDSVTSSLYEEAEVSNVTASYIDLTANLTYDYAIGALVMVAASGEAAFWARCVATVVTTEEQKRFRFSVRL